MGPDDHRGGANADNPMTKEEAAMEAMAGNDDVTMAKMMWAKNLLMVKMFAVAEVMRLDMASTKFWMQSASAKGCMEATGLAQVPSEVAPL
jgi:hypothetical protein